MSLFLFCSNLNNIAIITKQINNETDSDIEIKIKSFYSSCIDKCNVFIALLKLLYNK